jgi:GDP-L-fucose synthase
MIDPTILGYFRDKDCLITGGTGLIGRQVVDILCNAGARTTIVSLDRVEVDPRANHIFGDLTSLDFCKEMIKNRDVVFHLAGVKGSMEVSKTMLASHFVPTLMMNTNMLEACRVNGVKKAVYTSSIGAYADADVFVEEPLGTYSGPPLDFAGWAKRMGELQVYAYKTQYQLENFAIVRPSATYGPGDNFDPKSAMVVPSLIAQIHQGKPLEVWGDGSAIRDIAFSRDIAEGIVLGCYHGTEGYVNLGSGKGVTVRELIETLASFLDFKYTFDPSKPSGQGKKLLDITKARKLLNYEPATTLREGLEATWNWYIAHLDEHTRKQNYFTKN